MSFNTVVGFKHQMTGKNLHSHDTSDEKVTPKSKNQQGIPELIYMYQWYMYI